MPRWVADIDTSEIFALRQGLEFVREQGFPQAVRSTLNELAFITRSTYWPQQVNRQFIIRQKLNRGTFAVMPARARTIARMISVVHTTKNSEHLAKIEEGRTKTAKGGAKSAPIPTRRSRMGGNKRRKVAKANKLKNIQLPDRRVTHGTRDEQISGNINLAKKQGMRFAWIPLKGSDGGAIVRIHGRSLKRKSRLTMVWNMKHKSIRIKADPHARAAQARAMNNFPKIARAALVKQGQRALKKAMNFKNPTVFGGSKF